MRSAWIFSFTLAVCVAVSACGGSKDSGTGGDTPSPSQPTSSPAGGGGGNTATITIANNTVSPKSVTIARGGQVTFINNDNQPHDMSSDPHPFHTDCPEINQAGFLVPGQSRQTAPMPTVRTCGFHDHNQDLVESLKGTIVIQ